MKIIIRKMSPPPWREKNLEGSYIGNLIELLESLVIPPKGGNANSLNFYEYLEKYRNNVPLKEIIGNSYKNEPQIKGLKIHSLLQLFNNLAISILKAEYLLFDNYSENLNQLSEFYEIIDPKTREPIQGAILREVAGPEKEIFDHYLVKSILKTLYHVISMCKIIDTKIDCRLINKNISLINTDFEARLIAIYPQYTDSNKFIEKEIIDFFEETIFSIIQLTLIDHCYYLNLENINALVQCFERICKFSYFIEKHRLDSLENIDNKVIGDFEHIVEIVKYKSSVLLQQMVDYYEKETGKKFYNDFHFIISGTAQRTVEFRAFFKNKQTLLDYKNYPLADDFDRKKIHPILEHYENHFQGYDLKTKLGFFTIDEKNFYKSEHATTLQTHQDIVTFNEGAEKSIELHIAINKVILEVEARNDITILEDKAKEVEKFYKNTTLYPLNPTAYKYLIESLYAYLETVFNLKDKNDDPLTAEEVAEIRKYYDLYEKILNDYKKFIHNKKLFDVGELRFFPPFHNCFYKLTQDTISFHSIRKTNLPYIAEKDKANYLNFKDNDCCFFFFMSLYRVPLNLKHLEEKQLEYENYYIKIRERHRSLNLKVRFNDLKKTTADQIKDHNAAGVEFEKKLENNSRNYTTILGILGSFIAFTTISIGAWNVIANVVQFVIFALAYIFALSCFVFLIKFNPSVDKKENKKAIKSICWFLCVIVVISAILLFVYNKEFFELPQEKPNTNITIDPNITIDQSKVNSDNS